MYSDKKTAEPVEREMVRLRTAFKRMLRIHSKMKKSRAKLCGQCGAPCQNLTAQFWIDGDGEMFRIALPFCPDCSPDLIARPRRAM